MPASSDLATEMDRFEAAVFGPAASRPEYQPAPDALLGPDAAYAAAAQSPTGTAAFTMRPDRLNRDINAFELAEFGGPIRPHEPKPSAPLWRSTRQVWPGRDLDPQARAWLSDFARSRVVTEGPTRWNLDQAFEQQFGRRPTAGERRGFADLAGIYDLARRIVAEPLDQSVIREAARSEHVHRAALLQAVGEVAAAKHPLRELGPAKRTAAAGLVGINTMARNIGSMLGVMGLSDEDSSFVNALAAELQQADPLISQRQGLPTRILARTAEMAPAMVGSLGASMVPGIAPLVVGAWWSTQIYPETHQRMLEEGVDPKTAGISAALSAAAQAAVFSLHPDMFSSAGPRKAVEDAVMQSVGRYMARQGKNVAAGATVLSVNAAMDSIIHSIATHKDVPDAVRDAIANAAETAKSSIGPLALMAAPGIVKGLHGVRTGDILNSPAAVGVLAGARPAEARRFAAIEQPSRSDAERLLPRGVKPNGQTRARLAEGLRAYFQAADARAGQGPTPPGPPPEAAQEPQPAAAQPPARPSPELRPEEDRVGPEQIVNPIDRQAPTPEKVRQLEGLSRENAPLVDRIIGEVDRTLGTQSKRSFKETQKIAAKAKRPSILAKKPWHDVEHIRDALRFKTAINSFEDVPRTLDMIRQAGVGLVKMDTDKMLHPKEWGWRFAGFDLRFPNGQVVEYYMPLREMDAAKKTGSPSNHDLFERWREKPRIRQIIDPRYWRDLKKSRRRYNEAWKAALVRLGLSDTAAEARWNQVVASLGSSTGSKLSFRSSGVGASTRQVPSEPSTTVKSSLATQTLPSEGSRETRKSSMSGVSGVRGGESDITETSTVNIPQEPTGFKEKGEKHAQQEPEATQLHANVREQPGAETRPGQVPAEAGGQGVREGRPEGRKVQGEEEVAPRPGTEQRVMGTDSTLQQVETIDGVRYEFYKAKEPGETKAAIRVFDQDAGEVVSITSYRSYEKAVRDFQDVLKKNGVTGESAPARTAGQMSDAELDRYLEDAIATDLGVKMDQPSKAASKPPPAAAAKQPKRGTKADVARRRVQARVKTARQRLGAKRVEVDADLKSAFDAIKTYLDGKAFAGVDPELVRLTARALRSLTRKGVVEFSDAVLALAEHLPDHIAKMHDAIEAGWRALGRIDERLSGPGRVSDVLLSGRPAHGQEGPAQAGTKAQVRPGQPRGRPQELAEGRDEGIRAPGHAAPGPHEAEVTPPAPERGGQEGGPGLRPKAAGRRGVHGVPGGGGGERLRRGRRDRNVSGHPAARPGLEAAGGAESRPDVANYHITDQDAIGRGSIRDKYRANVEAIGILKQIEAAGRPATAEERAGLVKYSGWGAMPQAFEDATGKWKRQIAELKGLLTPKEWAAARHSTRNAHYTSREVIDAMWAGLRDLGFEGGEIGEPALGIGHFFGLMPPEIAAKSRLRGVELDELSGRIARALYPQADVRIEGYQRVKWLDNGLDLAISNVPFGKGAIADATDRGLTRLKAPIHDFYFSKTLRKVRPGGLVAFISSRYSLDKLSAKFRRDWAEQADLIGAVRLPDTAFKANAGTEVVTDILVFQKRQPGAKPAGESFIESRAMKVGDRRFAVNEYYHRHPDHILGTAEASGTMQAEGQYNVEPIKGQNLGEQIRRAIAGWKIDRAALGSSEGRTEAAAEAAGQALATPLRDGNLFIKDGRLYQQQAGRPVEHEIPERGRAGNMRRIAAMIGIRDAGRELLRLEQDPEAADRKVAIARRRLNRLYDVFVAKYKALNSSYNRKRIEDDSDAPFLWSLEAYDRDTRTAEKAAIFTKRTQFPVKPIEHVDSAADALATSLNVHGGVDLDYMSRVSGRDRQAIIEELGEHLFEDPAAGWQTSDRYLTGNVRRKLSEAREAAQRDPDRYQRNVKALEAAQPEDILPGKIGVRLGSPWIPTEEYDAFISEVLGGAATVRYNRGEGTWSIDAPEQKWDRVEYGTPEMHALKILEKTLNHRNIRIKDREGGLLTAETEAALAKQERLQNRFRRWIWANDQRTERLVRLYNDTQNNTILPRYDGSHLTFPGMNAALVEEMRAGKRAYRRDVVWRVISQGNTLIAHEVGGGKTITAAAVIMEMRRLGRWKKPVVVVPNHLLGHWRKEFPFAYPGARVLVAEPADFTRARRQTLFNRIATGDWDAVVVPQSSFKRMPVSKPRMEAFYKAQLAELEEAVRSEKAEKGSNRNYVKELEAARDRLEGQLEAQEAEYNKDVGPFFDELGVDAIVVDESQGYKNLWFRTKMGQIPGVDPVMNQGSFDMLMKTRYVNELTGERGVVFLTGTPITNTVGEMYTLSRYLQPRMMAERGVEAFDSWADTFGLSVSSPEVDVTGEGVRMKTRFRSFYNLPELQQMYHSIGDIKSGVELGLKRPRVRGGKAEAVVAPRSEELEAIVGSLVERAERLRTGKVDPSEDNFLNITTDGRKAAIDLRLYDPNLPDRPDSKLNRAVENVYRIWEETKDRRAAQVVWLDVGVPRGKSINLYADLKAKWVRRGIPASQIAFIHEGTPKTVGHIFERMNQGKVRILIGSTIRMGTGANIQKRLIAAHHLDAPWRPADVEQRDGRIIRFGNDNPEVQIYRYVTKGSFDAYNWQTLDNKAQFLNQLNTSAAGAREIEDVAKEPLSYAEITALAAQDPRILDLTRLRSEVHKLEVSKQTHLNTQYRHRRRLMEIPRERQAYRDRLAKVETNEKLIEKAEERAGGKLDIVLDGVRYDKHKAAGERLNAIRDEFLKTDDESKPIGKFLGFLMTLRRIETGHARLLEAMTAYREGRRQTEESDAGGENYEAYVNIQVGTERLQTSSLGQDAVGNIKRIQFPFENFKRVPEQLRAELTRLAADERRIKPLAEQPFEQQAELEQKQQALARLQAELMQKPQQVAAPPILRKDVAAVFPGSKIVQRPGGPGWRVGLGGGHYVDLRIEPEIQIDWQQAEQAAGRKIPDAERADLEAAGAFELHTADGTAYTGLGLIHLADGLADRITLRHEAVHLARQAGMFRPTEWDALVREYSDPARAAVRQEEDVAAAREVWAGDGGLAARVRTWIRELLDRVGIARIDAESVQHLMDQSAFWARRPRIEEDEGGPLLFQLVRRRRPLANPAVEAVARDLVREVDELRDQAGEPQRRKDALVEAQAAGRLAKDYDAELGRLLAAAREGRTLTDADVLTAKSIVNREGVQAVASGDADRIDRAMSIINAYRRTGTEQARAFRQRHDPVQTPAERRGRAIVESLLTPPERALDKAAGDPEAVQKVMRAWAKQIKRIRKQLRGLGLDLDRLDRYTHDDVTAARVQGTISAAKAGLGDKAFEYWANAILSAPTTQAANIGGNFFHSAWHFTAERFAEAAANTILRRAEGAQFGEFKYLLSGILPGLSRGARNFARSWKSETPYFERELGLTGHTKLEEPRVAIGGLKGRVVRGFGYRPLLAVDEFSKSIIGEMEAGARAYRIARSEGLTGPDLRHRIAALTADIASPAWQAAAETAIDLTFQKPLGRVGRVFLKARRDIPFLRYMIPFVTTPANIFRTGIQKSPLGTLKLAARVYRGLRTGSWEGITPLVAQQMLAWSATLALMGYMDDDQGDPRITGAAAQMHYGTRRTARRTFPSQSVRIGDRWYSYSRLEPFATTLSLTVDWIRALQSGDPSQSVRTPIDSLIGQVKNKTFLAGVADILDMLDADQPVDKMLRWAGSFTTSWIPNIVRSGLRARTETYPERAIWGQGPEWLDRVMRRTLQRTELGIVPDQPAYDLWGRPAPRPQAPYASGPRTDWAYRFLVPMRNKKIALHVGDRALVNWNNDHPEHPWHPSTPARWYKDAAGKRQSMTDGQYAQYARLAGRTASKLVELEIRDPGQPTEQDINAIRRAISEARRQVKGLLVAEWTGKAPAGAAVNDLAEQIFEHQVVIQADRMSRPRPAQRKRWPAWQAAIDQARSWLAARKIKPSELRGIYYRHLRKTLREPKSRRHRMGRLLYRMRQAG